MSNVAWEALHCQLSLPAGLQPCCQLLARGNKQQHLGAVPALCNRLARQGTLALLWRCQPCVGYCGCPCCPLCSCFFLHTCPPHSSLAWFLCLCRTSLFRTCPDAMLEHDDAADIPRKLLSGEP